MMFHIMNYWSFIYVIFIYEALVDMEASCQYMCNMAELTVLLKNDYCILLEGEYIPRFNATSQPSPISSTLGFNIPTSIAILTT